MTLLRLPDPYYADPSTGELGPGFSSIELTMNSPSMAHDLNDGSTVTTKVAASFWEANLGYTELTPQEAATLHSFLLRLDGRMTPFQVLLPQYRYPKNGATGLTEGKVRTVYVSTIYAAGTNTVKFTNWKALSTPVQSKGKELSVGDMIKFAGKSKTYLVTSISYNSIDNNGELTVGIMPPLANTIDIDDRLVTDEPLITVRSKTDNLTMSLSTDLYYSGFSLSIKEDTRGYTY